MQDKICCFAGHKDIYGETELKESVYNKCEELITEKAVNCFWVGHYGNFDGLTARTVRELKKKYPHIKLELILPYITKGVNDYKELYYKDYDNIIMADIPERTPTKYRIIKCNQYMVDCSEFLIAFVNYSFGGAVKTLEYAQKRDNIEIFNFGTYTV